MEKERGTEEWERKEGRERKKWNEVGMREIKEIKGRKKEGIKKEE